MFVHLLTTFCKVVSSESKFLQDLSLVGKVSITCYTTNLMKSCAVVYWIYRLRKFRFAYIFTLLSRIRNRKSVSVHNELFRKKLIPEELVVDFHACNIYWTLSLFYPLSLLICFLFYLQVFRWRFDSDLPRWHHMLLWLPKNDHH